ncbi:CDP-glucose 4,6-dehydratase [Gemmatimonadota bacterium]
MFADAYRDRRVLVTGHTGFKGSWLTSWLLKLGAEVIGVSKDVPTQPAMFDELSLANRVTHVQGDIRDGALLHDILADEQPDFVFHLAAQAIVSLSYSDPEETITTNVVGTMNVLEALRKLDRPCFAVLITSDKCYDNVEWVWGYRETDALGGKDVYSGSKGAAELVIKSYVHSFFRHDHPVRLAVGRAGNVIGGGDWAKDRIVADCVRAWSEDRGVEIRNPEATRPWQHVLEPLSGYLSLGQHLADVPQLHGEAFNFGPRAEEGRTVVNLIEDLARHWGLGKGERGYRIADGVPFHEASLLKLNCDKALFQLGWEPNLDFAETIAMVGRWYADFYSEAPDMFGVTLEQIAQYESLALERNRTWTRP